MHADRGAWAGGLREGRAGTALGARRERRGRVLRAGQGGPSRGPAEDARGGEGATLAPAEKLEDAGSAGADEVIRCGRVPDGVRAAVRTAARARRPALRHLPVPSLAAARAPRSLVDQLADRDGQDAHGPHHLLAQRGSR